MCLCWALGPRTNESRSVRARRELELENLGKGGEESELNEIDRRCTVHLYEMLAVLALSASAYQAPMASRPAVPAAAAARSVRPVMDETIIQKAFAGELEEEGAENVFMSELGWASYLDKQAGSSYNMNERVSQASDGYFTPDVFSNPVEGAHRATSSC